MRMCLIIRFDGYRNAYFSSFHLYSSLHTYGATIQRKQPMQRIMMELK